MKNKKIVFFVALLGAALSSCTPTNETTEPNKDFTNVAFNDQTVDYDGNEHILDEVSNVPEGTNIVYQGRSYYTDVGTYEATASLKKQGYNDLTLSAKLTIVPIDFSNISFEDIEVVYDGQPHEILCQNVPSFATVTYINNVATGIGTYNAKAIIKAPNYNDLTLKATMKIIGKTITGVSLNDKSFEYDGQAHSLEVEGILPDGVSVSYSNNSLTNVGSKTVTATLSGEGYVTLKLSATLTIVGMTITGVSLDSKTFVYDGKPHSLEVSGAIPNGVKVTYSNNSRTSVGSQTVTAKLAGTNYEILTLSATLTIVSLDTAFGIDQAKEAYQLNDDLNWSDTFNGLLQGNYTLRWYGDSRSSLDESFYFEDLDSISYTLIASDGVNLIKQYHSEFDKPYDSFDIFCDCGDDAVHHSINSYGDGGSFSSKLPAAALMETEIQYYPANAFTALSRGDNDELLPGYNSDDYYGDNGEYLVHNNHLYIKHEHPRSSSSGTIYFYTIFEFYNIGNTKLDLPSSLFFDEQQIDSLGLTNEDFYIDGVRYGYHLVSTWNSPTEFMAHTFIRDWQKLIVAPEAHFVYPGFYDRPVERVVFTYYTEQKYIIPDMEGYGLNFCFDASGNYQGEYSAWGTVTDRSSDFESYGGTRNYYGSW